MPPSGWTIFERYRSSQHQHPKLKRLSVSVRVPTLLLTKKIQDFSRTPKKNFPWPFWSPRMFKYKENTAFTYNIQSVVHCRKFSMKQNVDVCCSEFRWTYLHIYITCSDCRSSLEVTLGCLFSIWTTRKMHDFQGYFSRTFQDQSDFRGLSRSWNFQEKKSRTFQEAWEPWSVN